MNKNQKEGFKVFLKDKRKKSYPRILYEFFYLWRIKKSPPWYYFKFLYRKEVNNVKDYLSTKEAYKIKHYPKFHQKEYMTIMDNKLSFSLFCKENGLPIARLIGYNFKSSFFFNGELHKIKDERELGIFFNKVFEKTNKNRFFLKPISSYGGTGAKIITRENLGLEIQENFNAIVAADYIYEDVLVQHDEINKIQASSINSIRFETFIDKKGKVHVINAFMRFGLGDCIVDNANAGGVYVGVNMEKGTLKEVARGHIYFGYDDYLEHPDSKYPFKDFAIPFFEEACKLVAHATECLPDRYIGWDVAITNDGPVIIEANQDPGIFVSDASYGGYLKHPIFKEILEEANEWEPV